MLNILKLIHMFLALNAIGAGIALCIRMVTGRLFEVWVRYFLRFSLGTGSVGLILSIDHTSLTQLLTMLSVYVSALAVFFWRKSRISDTWAPAVVVSTMCVLCLDTVIMIAHIFKFLAAFNVVSLARPEIPLAISMVTAVLLFGLLGATALKNIHPHASNSLIRKAAR